MLIVGMIIPRAWAMGRPKTAEFSSNYSLKTTSDQDKTHAPSMLQKTYSVKKNNTYVSCNSTGHLIFQSNLLVTTVVRRVSRPRSLILQWQINLKTTPAHLAEMRTITRLLQTMQSGQTTCSRVLSALLPTTQRVGQCWYFECNLLQYQNKDRTCERHVN